MPPRPGPPVQGQDEEGGSPEAAAATAAAAAGRYEGMMRKSTRAEQEDFQAKQDER